MNRLEAKLVSAVIVVLSLARNDSQMKALLNIKPASQQHKGLLCAVQGT
jgi:hypothetical protein